MKKYYLSLKPFKGGVMYEGYMIFEFPKSLEKAGLHNCIGLCPIFESYEDLAKYDGGDSPKYVMFEADML